MFISVKTVISIFEHVLVESVVNCRMKWSFGTKPFFCVVTLLFPVGDRSIQVQLYNAGVKFLMEVHVL